MKGIAEMKKMLSLLLSILMIFTFSVPVFAQEGTISNGNIVASEELSVISQGYRIVQDDEVVSLLMKKAGYSYTDALQIVTEASTRAVTLGERWIKYNAGMGYTIEVGCLVEVECGSGHCNFGDVIEKWSEASGSGDYNWDAFYVYAEVGGPYATSINFRSRGNLEVTVATSSSAGFEAAGFSVVGSVTTTTTYRKTISIDETWTVGDPLE